MKANRCDCNKKFNHFNCEVLPDGGDEFWTKPARDLAQVLITFGNYDKQELIDRLINQVTIRNKIVQLGHVEVIAQQMLDNSLIMRV